MRVSRTVHIDAPVERVWRVATDVERWPEWASYMRSLVPQDEGPLRMGSRVRVTPKGMPGSVWTVTEFDEGRSYTWETSLAPGLRLAGGHVYEAEGAGTSATFSLATAGPLGVALGPALGLVFRRNTRLATDGLKAHCEAAT